MKESEIKLLVILDLIGGKLNKTNLINKGITSEKELNKLLKLEVVKEIKNVHGIWYYITPKGSLVTTAVNGTFKSISNLTSMF
jgi:hypothetical protein